MSRIRVIHLLWSFEVGGAEKLLVTFVRHLDRARYEPAVCVFAENGPLREEMETLEAPLFTVRRASVPGTMWRVAKVMRRFKPHLIHGHSIGPAVYAALGGLLTRAPVLTTWHGQPVHSQSWSFARMLFNRLTDRFVAVSDDVRQRLVADADVAPEKTCTIVNGIDFSPLNGARDAGVRKKLGIPADAFLFGTVGRLHYIKVQSRMLIALRKLLDKGHNAYLVLAGEGEMRGELERAIADLSIERRAKLLGTWHEIPALLRALDGFLLSSDREGVPLSLLEAMGAGVVPISTAVGGIPDIISHEGSGLLVAPGDVAGLGAAMERLITEPDLRQRLGVEAARSVRARFSLERMMDAYCKEYETLLHERDKSRSKQ